MSDTAVIIDEMVVGDTAEAWAAAGFAVDADGTCRLGTVRCRLAGTEGGRGILGWSLRGIAAPQDGAIDGIPTSVAQSPTAPDEPTAHPNGVTGLDHVVLISADGERTAAALTAATGLEVRRVRETESYGAPMRQWFFRAGDVIIELVAPEAGRNPAPAGFFGLAMNVSDIDALPALYGEALSDPKDAVQPGRRIASLRHRQLHMSVPIAFMTPEPGTSTPH